ncbi:hypothetical protein MNV49_007468 [Pseudohyphozyma bogoriensis]|nr:hypothetical protein MNV49_007468 [Pseudohyphozyma bogoriensis]
MSSSASTRNRVDDIVLIKNTSSHIQHLVDAVPITHRHYLKAETLIHYVQHHYLLYNLPLNEAIDRINMTCSIGIHLTHPSFSVAEVEVAMTLLEL